MTTPIVVLDWETFYDSDYSLSKITTEEYIRSPQFEDIGVSILLPDQSFPVWYTEPTEIKRALHAIDWSTHAMLAHNNYFDGAILAWRYGIHPKLLMCTMCMGQPHFGFTSGVSLAKLAEVMGAGVKGTEVVRALGKRRHMFTPQELATYGDYCCNDAVLCKRIFNKLLPMTPKKELLAIDEAIKCFTDPRISLDRELVAEHHQQVVDTKMSNYIWAGNLLGVTPEEVKTTIMSNDKLALALTELGVDPPTKLSPSTGKVAYAFAKTDEEFLDLKEHENEAVQLLVECRLGGKSTLAETRAYRLLGVAERGLLPIYLKYYAAHTGRLGGGDALNMQNLPQKSPLRRALCAPPAHLLVGGDLSQIEARLLATVAGQHDVVQAFKDYDAGIGPDIYCVTASAFLGRPVTKADRKERQLGKVIRLALGYGMGVPKFINTARKDGVILTPADAQAAHSWFRDASPAIKQLWKNADFALKKLLAGESWTFGCNDCIEVRADGLHLPSGRVIRYPGLAVEPDEQGRPQYSYLNRRKRMKIYGAKVVENIMQSLAGSVCGDAWLRLRGKMKVVLQAHDELVSVVHATQVEWGKATMKWAMTYPVAWLPSLPVACSIGAAFRYGDVEK